MASAGNRVILFRSLSLALCKQGELAVELLPEAFLGLGEELDDLWEWPVVLGGVACEAAPTAAFKVLSNICNNFIASGPNLEGSVPKEAAKGENNAAIAVLDEGVALEVEPGVEGVAALGGMNKPGCNIANKLCCCAGVIAIGFIDVNAANDCEVVEVVGVALGLGGMAMGVEGVACVKGSSSLGFLAAEAWPVDMSNSLMSLLLALLPLLLLFWYRLAILARFCKADPPSGCGAVILLGIIIKSSI